MSCIKMDSLIHNSDSSLLIDEIASAIAEVYSEENVSIEKSQENLRSTKGIITTAVVAEFMNEVAKTLTVAAIEAIVCAAVKKIFTKKEVESVQIKIEDDKITVKASDNVDIEIHINK